MILWLDFESRSRCDLLSRGVYNYAQDSSTDVLCMSYAFDDGDVITWTPDKPFPEEVRNFKGQIRAHNATFERLVFWYVLQINFDLTQFYCTATQARANCAPGSLEDVGRFSGATMRKDHRGKQLIRLLSLPRADGTFNDDPTLMAEMIAYCEQDVKVMRTISKALRNLSDQELADYHVNERINDKGVLLDKPLADSAIRYASVELEEIERIVSEVTKGAITSVRSPRMREWVIERVGPEALKLMTVIKDGEKKMSIDKSVRANLLLLAEENPDEVPADVADVIQCADDLWASSVAKFNRLSQLADVEDNRVRGAFVFAGGSATGRASSYGAQVHNFTRKCAKDPESVRQAMVRGHAIVPTYGKRITDVLKGMLRPALIPAKGKSLVVADWNAVEARLTPWLSNDPRAEEVLDVFRSGRDIYIREAAAIFHQAETEITPDKRQIGKVAILSCGFGGGVGAFGAMGRNYGIILSESDAKRTVDAWRRANQWAVNYWQSLESAYTRAMRNVGKEFSVGRVTYLYDGVHLWYALPSGRILCYPYARLEAIPAKQKIYASDLLNGDRSDFETATAMMLDAARSNESPLSAYSQNFNFGVTYAKAAWKPSADATEWPRARLWKGLACENITQAVANDLLRHSLRELDKKGLSVILHVHDEIILEVDDSIIDFSSATLSDIMCTTPAWAEGLPLNIDLKVMTRYGK